MLTIISLTSLAALVLAATELPRLWALASLRRSKIEARRHAVDCYRRGASVAGYDFSMVHRPTLRDVVDTFVGRPLT